MVARRIPGIGIGSTAARRRELEQQYRADTQQRISNLRKQLKGADRAKRDRLLEVKALCERAGKQLERRIAARREAFEAEVDAERYAAKEQCRTAAQRARSQGDMRMSAIDRELLEVKGQRRRDRIWQGKLSEPSRRTALADRQAESDSEVEHNIDPAMLPIWRAVKRRIKPTARMTRTEAFLQWVHDHEAEVRVILSRAEKLDEGELQAAERAHHERDYDPDDVPF